MEKAPVFRVLEIGGQLAGGKGAKPAAHTAPIAQFKGQDGVIDDMAKMAEFTFSGGNPAHSPGVELRIFGHPENRPPKLMIHRVFMGRITKPQVDQRRFL